MDMASVKEQVLNYAMPFINLNILSKNAISHTNFIEPVPQILMDLCPKPVGQ
jgi:hypothetical protein